MALSEVVPQSVHIHNYLHLLGVVILYYDYLITVGEEYRRIWTRRKFFSSYLFYLNRYLPLLADIAVNFGNFYEFPTELVRCRHYAFFRQVLLIVNQVVVCYILYLRTYALYGRDWRVGGTVLVFAGCLLAVSCWAIVGQHSDVELKGGCHLLAGDKTAVRLAVAWESLFAFDFTIFSLTLFKTYRERKLNPTSSGRRDIVYLLMRDGAMYFAVMASANLANTLTFYFLEPILRGCLSTAASSISITMMSRLMLNLQASAAPSTTYGVTTHTSGPSGATSDDSAQLFFTTRFTMPPGTTTAWDLEGNGGTSRGPGLGMGRGGGYGSGPRRASAYIRGAQGEEGYIGEVYEMQDPHRGTSEDTRVHPGDEDDDDGVALEDRFVGKRIVDDWR